MEETPGAKEKLLNTVVTLLMEGQDIAPVTNRQIAAMAGVNSALINYYFQSKENLINTAAGICMEHIADTLYDPNNDLRPPDRIKRMLKNFSDFCFKNLSFSEIAVRSDLKQGSTYTSEMLFPLFKEYFGDTKTDYELKLLSFQLLHPMQILFINREEYNPYLSCNLTDPVTWNHMIEKLVDNIFQSEDSPYEKET